MTEPDRHIGDGDHVSLSVPARPFNSGEVMIVPRRRVRSMAELTVPELSEIADWIGKIEAVMERVYNPQGINVGLNVDGDRPVEVHVVPRWIGDVNFMPVTAGFRVLPESLEKTVKVYRDALFPG